MVIEVVPSINNAVTINSTRDYTAYFTMHLYGHAVVGVSTLVLSLATYAASANFWLGMQSLH